MNSEKKFHKISSSSGFFATETTSHTFDLRFRFVNFFSDGKRFTATTKLIFFTTFDHFFSEKDESRENEKRDFNVTLLYVGNLSS